MADKLEELDMLLEETWAAFADAPTMKKGRRAFKAIVSRVVQAPEENSDTPKYDAPKYDALEENSDTPEYDNPKYDAPEENSNAKGTIDALKYKALEENSDPPKYDAPEENFKVPRCRKRPTRRTCGRRPRT